MAKSGMKAAVGRAVTASTQETRDRVIRGAIDALKEQGFAGASAQEIPRRAGCNQGLVFYHFGSVTNLLLAALDDVSGTRQAHYQAAVDRADGLGELVTRPKPCSRRIWSRPRHGAGGDDRRRVGDSGPGARGRGASAPWRQFAADALGGVLSDTPLAAVVEPDVAAHAVVALYLGWRCGAPRRGPVRAALALFARARQLAAVVADVDRRSCGPRGREQA